MASSISTLGQDPIRSLSPHHLFPCSLPPCCQMQIRRNFNSTNHSIYKARQANWQADAGEEQACRLG